MTMPQPEIGGDFHWTTGIPHPVTPWPESSAFFARGRDAVTSIMQAGTSGARLFVPHYFCEDITSAWVRAGVSVERFHLIPQSADVRFHETPSERDYVMFVNYFGVAQFGDVGSATRREFGCSIIEDHTHDPLSAWAKSSTADFCYASLRKTLPLSDGAVAWSPTPGGRARVETPETAYRDHTLVASMALKSAYLAADNQDPALKRCFRQLQAAGHAALEAETGSLGISDWSRSMISAGYPTAWREMRTRNARLLVDILSADLEDLLLFSNWQEDQCPFVVVLYLQSEAQRDDVRAKLIAHDVYPPVHWVCNTTNDQAARDLGRRVLSIPVDHRYSVDDIARVAEHVQKALTT